MAFFIIILVSSVTLTNGNLTSSSHKFINLAAYFTGLGLLSTNIAPKLCSEFQKLSIKNDEKSISEAQKLDKILQPIHHSMFIESNPSPVKYAAKLLNLCDDSVRLPMVGVTNSTKELIKNALLSAKLI